jgi:FkbM family methyltransferase
MTTANPVRLYNWELLVPNIKEYHGLKREIFSEHRYHFETNNLHPIIIDIGAYIGLSTLYFKRLFPQSTIMSIEPHPQAFELLQHNLEYNHIAGVLPVNQAVWSESGPIRLYHDDSPDHWWSTTSVNQFAWDETPSGSPLKAKAITLSDVVAAADGQIDLLKIDTEGAEWDILFKNYALFDQLKAIVVEYHPQKGRELADFIRMFPSDYEIAMDKKGQPAKNNTYQGGLVTVWAVKK